jgi:hypothetical protein
MSTVFVSVLVTFGMAGLHNKLLAEPFAGHGCCQLLSFFCLHSWCGALG